MSTFRVQHDDQPDEILEKIVKALKEEGVEITIGMCEGEGDGWVDFNLNVISYSILVGAGG